MFKIGKFNFKKFFIQLLFAFLILSTSILLYLKYPAFFSLFESKINDSLLMARGVKTASEDIVIVDIDEKSLSKLGQWPWSRDKVARIIQNLAKNGVGIIGLDIVFAEKDNSSPALILKRLGIKREVIDYDKVLADTIAQTPTIVGYVFSLTNDGLKPTSSPENSAIFIEKNRPESSSFIIKPYRAILNIPIIQNSAYSSGYFNTIPDRDGVVRSIPMLMRYNGLLYPALSLEMIRVMLGEKRVFVNYSQNGVESITIGEVTIPTDRFGRMQINYRGPSHQYRYISAYDVYANKIKPKDVEGKIVIIGTSAAGLLDLRSTPFDSVYPGVEVHANAIDNIINQDFISSPSWVVGADLVEIALAVIITFLLLLIPSAVISFSLLILFLYGITVFHYYLMSAQGVILNTFFPVVSILTLFIIGQSINYFFESRQKERIKKKFATKVSPAVVEELMKSANENSFDVKEKEITIFFSDIRSFTTISEKIGSAKKLIDLLNEYMTPMVEIITKHKGTVDKFIGDAIMAYWNAPLDIKNHADLALTSAIEQILALKELNVKLSKENRPNIDIGIGLNTGLSVVGEMGSFGRSDYTCIGDAVNLASRAEGLCKPYGAKIILTEFTKEKLKDDKYLIRELDIVRVKGKEKPVAIYECMGFTDNHWVDFNEKYSSIYFKALSSYRDSDFEEALELFEELNRENECKLYKLYIERCQHYIVHKPENFDGVFTFMTK